MAADRGKDRHAKTLHRLEYMREYQRDYAWRQKYGMSRQDLLDLVAKQDGRCAICLQVFDLDAKGYSKSIPFPHVDHDHRTNEVRGLLCNSCNVALGSFGDSIQVVARAYLYLKAWLDRQKQPAST